ncbi:recombinase family protein [Wohlfahrtiimonas chitiniclastica]|nr:recombinase family protein [Wohlfahrtiimonas chitiniclastica]
MIIRIYLRASTQDQDAERALLQTTSFCKNHYSAPFVTYIENISGTKLNR